MREFIYRMWIHSETCTWHDKNIQTTCSFIKRETLTHTFTHAQCASVRFNSDRKIIKVSIGVHWLICLLQTTRKTSGKGILKKIICRREKPICRCIQQKYHTMTAHFCHQKKILIKRVAIVGLAFKELKKYIHIYKFS